MEATVDNNKKRKAKSDAERQQERRKRLKADTEGYKHYLSKDAERKKYEQGTYANNVFSRNNGEQRLELAESEA